ncbi:hypothetical protein C8A03DRAFT_14872 [Achaetomium macrosporum]|uniref:Zn(2)-C6 fungal-type domain-containing protein n=1 Tax=Achaetomium macrosporum TaxID=79813 RepID=A0AAN7HFU0_9PEZI|nr:hypothetical protein C8A03DRAFT_14872 [Achaetomium macrosporum]
MATQRSTKGVPASYGRACIHCARAKCRCIYRSADDATCERCLRLKKQCTLQPSVRKWNGRQTNSARISRLEDQLQELVGLLKNSAATGQPIRLGDTTLAKHGLGTPLSSTGSATHSPDDQMLEEDDDSSDVSTVPAVRVSLDPSSSSQRSSATWPAHTHSLEPRVPGMPEELATCAEQLTPEEAEHNFSEFRKHNAFSAPFLCFAPDVTSARLREERPFLWLNLMAVTTKSLPQQRRMNQAIKQHLAQAMVVEDEKDLDLLWGLLIFMSWSHYHQKMKPHLTLMGCLAHSLIYDLVLHRPQAEASKMAFITNNASCDEPAAGESPAEARRAVLGCFVVTSIIATSQKRLEPLTWTSYFEDCLEQLAQQPQWLGDTVLVAAVRYQLVVNQIVQILRKPHDSNIPLSYVDALRLQIYNIRREIPEELATNEILATQILQADLLLHETALQSLSAASTSSSPDLQRHTALSAQLDAVRRFFDDVFFAIPPVRYAGLPVGFWDQTAHFLTALFRLSRATAADPTGALDVAAICERLAAGFAQAAVGWEGAGHGGEGQAQEEQEEEGPDIFTKCRHWAKGLRERWLAERKEAAAAAAAAAAELHGYGPGSGGSGGIRGEGGPGEDGVGDAPGFMMPGSTGFFENDAILRGPATLGLFQTGDGWLTDIFQTSWD